MSNNIYNILGKLNALTESAEPAAPQATVYETVEPRGSISEAVKSLEGKYAKFKEDKDEYKCILPDGSNDVLFTGTKSECEAWAEKGDKDVKIVKEAKKAKPDFLDVDSDGDKAEPFKKAVKDKKAGSADKGMSAKQAKYFGKKKVSEDADKSKIFYGAITHPDGEGEELQYKFQVKNGKPVVVGCEDDRYWDECQADVEKYHHQISEGMGMSDELAAKKIAAKIQGTPDLNVTKIKQHVNKYLTMVGKQPSDVDHLAALVNAQLQDKGLAEGAGPYTLDDPKHPKFKANYEKYKKAHPDCKLADFVAAMRKKEKGLSEGMDDLTDLDAYQFAEPDKDSAVKPASAKQAAADRRRRLQDLEDRRAEKNDSYSDTKSNVRKVAGRAYGGSAQKDDSVDEATTATGGEVTKVGNVTTHKGKKYGGAETNSNAKEELGRKNIWDLKRPGKPVDLGDPEDYELDEVAPPGAKAERMVKHIKKGYADDGKLTKREKGIAYATAWKAKKAGNLEEATEFGDTIKNSAATMKKAKLAKLKESRVMEETDYFYEKVGKALAGKNPNLDTAGSDFVAAVRKEMIAQGIEPNRARNILIMDEDFLSDVATSYDHCCKEMHAETKGAPMNSHLGGMADLDEVLADPHEKNIPRPTGENPITSELDEIAQLAGLPVKETDTVYNEVNHEEVEDTMDEGALPVMDEAQGVTVNGKLLNVNSIEVDGVDPSDRPDFVDAYITYAEFADGTPLDEKELLKLEDEHGEVVNQAAHNSLQGAGDFLEEEDMAEGNEFSGALKAARDSGAKEFEVDGKRYTVKEDINVNITANGEEDALNLFRKLAGMDEVTPAVTGVAVPVDAETAIAQGMVEPVEVEVDEDRDIEYANTPNEKIGPVSAAVPSGDDMHKAKKSYSDKPYRGDNPMAVKEATDDSLWKKYSGMLKSMILK